MLTIFKTASDIEQKNGIFLKKKGKILLSPCSNHFSKDFYYKICYILFMGGGKSRKRFLSRFGSE